MQDDTQKEIKKLQEENEIKNEALSLTAHELRTSLASTKWMLKMLLDGDFGPVTQEQKTALSQGLENNERLITIVTDLINFSHNTDGTIPYTFVQTDLIPVITDTIANFSNESFKRGIPLVFNKTTSEVLATIDVDRFKVCLANLISNALKYSAPGAGVEVNLSLDADHIFIRVRDHGIGIPLEEQSDVFKKFFRASNAKKKESIGSGIGLYTSLKIAQNLKGDLTFESVEGAGSVFTICLPASPK